MVRAFFNASMKSKKGNVVMDVNLFRFYSFFCFIKKALSQKVDNKKQEIRNYEME